MEGDEGRTSETGVANGLFFRFLYRRSRRTNKKFNNIILHSLFMSRTNQPPISLSRVPKLMKLRGKDKNPIAVVVGTVTNNNRKLYCPNERKALCVTEKAREHIVKLGGIDPLVDLPAEHRPDAKNAPLVKLSPTSCNGRKYEKTRGRHQQLSY